MGQQQPQQQQFVQPRESTDYDYEYYDGAVPETSPRFNQQAPAQQTFVPAQPVQRVAQPVQPVRRPVVPANTNNPFINPFDASHRNPAAFAPAPTAAPRQQFQQTFQQPQQFQQTFQQPQQFAAPATRVTPEAPRNFFPPGQLQ